LTAPRVVIAAVQSPFLSGGAEKLVEGLHRELSARAFECDVVRLPLFERTGFDVAKSALLWRLGDFGFLGGRDVDALIATRFPSYLARHPRKVVWLVHQYRQAYDQFGTAYSGLTTSEDDTRAREMIRRMDTVGLSEARAVFTISRNVSDRLARYNGVESRALYPPPPLAGRYRCEPPQDYLLWVGRLERWKRPHLAVAALAHAPEVRLRIVGEGPERAALERLARELSVSDRCEMLGTVSDEKMIELFSRARAVAVTAADEDYGYVPLEAFLSGRPVFTVTDAGGPLEFVADGRTGIVTEPDPEALGTALRIAWNQDAALARMGERGKAIASGLGWDEVVERLTGAAGL
jgi:glycosyltransferase involved in cell wall biosynthesis